MKSEEQKEKRMKNVKKAYSTYRTQSKEIISALWKCQEKRKKGIENIFKAIMAKNFPNFWREMGHPDP